MKFTLRGYREDRTQHRLDKINNTAEVWHELDYRPIACIVLKTNKRTFIV